MSPRARILKLAKAAGFGYNAARLKGRIGAWRSPVARTVRVGEVMGSNPVAPTTNPAIQAGFLFFRTDEMILPEMWRAAKGSGVHLTD